MSKNKENEEKIMRYIEAMQKLIVSHLLQSQEFQTLKKEMEKEGYEIQEGIFAFLTKEPKPTKQKTAAPLEFKINDEDKNLLKQWGIVLS